MRGGRKAGRQVGRGHYLAAYNGMKGRENGIAVLCAENNDMCMRPDLREYSSSDNANSNMVRQKCIQQSVHGTRLSQGTSPAAFLIGHRPLGKDGVTSLSTTHQQNHRVLHCDLLANVTFSTLGC
eukprot:IDg19828t1